MYIGHCEEKTWRFFINVLIEDGLRNSPPITISSERGVRIDKPVIAADFGKVGLDKYICWRWPVEVTREKKDQWISYTIAPRDGVEVKELPAPVPIDNVVIPVWQEAPHIAFFSCNGIDDPKLLSRVEQQDALWQHLLDIHTTARTQPSTDHPGGYHVLIGGGDQIYTDSIWLEKGSPLKMFPAVQVLLWL